MKKALVLSLAVVLCLGVATFGQITGYWSSSIVLDPQPLSIVSMSSTFKVDYALSGWTFGSTTGFNLAGYSSQAFKVAGALGAFSLVSNMTFAPMVVTERTYPTITVIDPATICALWVATPTKWAPAFLKWDVSMAASIAGVGIDVYVLNDQSAAPAITNIRGLWTGTVALTQTDSVTCASTSAKGMGWRLKVDGSFGGVDVTSYTYFNMTEWDAEYYNSYYGIYQPCPIIGKSGKFVVSADCNTGTFKEEYLTVEGFTFGCATVDIGLKIVCTGFSGIRFLVNDIALGNWGLFTFAIDFTTSNKSVATCLSLTPLAGPCFTVELGGISGVTIEELSIYGFKFSSKFGGVTFTSITELDIDSTLMSDLGYWEYLNSSVTTGYFAPFLGKKPACGTTGVQASYYMLADNMWALQCVPTARYQLWEMFKIDVSSDACCGGLFSLGVSTYFGEYEELTYVGYGILEALAETYTGVTNLFGVRPTGDDDPFADLTYTNTSNYQTSTFATVYAAGSQTTLFNWAKSAVAMSVGLGSNVNFNIGFAISAFGFDSFTVGFKWSF